MCIRRTVFTGVLFRVQFWYYRFTGGAEALRAPRYEVFAQDQAKQGLTQPKRSESSNADGSVPVLRAE
jgi:hypothetical protein